MPVIDLVGRFFARGNKLIGVDYNDVVTTINVLTKYRLTFSD